MLGNEFNTLKTDKQQQKRIKHLSCLFFFLSFFLFFFLLAMQLGQQGDQTSQS